MQHTNPGAVTDRLTNLVAVRSSGKEQKIIEDGLDRARDRAFKDARYKTGYLRESIKTDSRPGYGQITVNAFYGRFIEEGTSHAHAFPFFWANVHASVDTIIQTLKELYMIK